MGYLFIKDFQLGMDRRKPRVSGVPGSLWTLKNAVVTRGGMLQRAKKFVSTYTPEAGKTFGLGAVRGNLYVFGSEAAPTVPLGLTYQRLQHADGTTAMTQVLDVDTFDGKLYVVAKFTDGAIFHYYDGTIVSDWHVGRVFSHDINLDGVAANLATAIDASDNYSATSSGSVITITGAGDNANADWEIDATATNGGSVDNQTAVVARTQQAVDATAEVLSSGSFRIQGGSSNPGTNKITNVQVNALEILNTAVDWTTSNQITAALVAAQINSYSSSPEYTAVADGDQVVITAAAGTGAGPNGFPVYVAAAGNVVVATGSFRIAAGTSNPGVNRITSITVNGVEILGANVNWATSHSAFAAALAAQIVAYASSPKYTAYADGPTVRYSPVDISDTVPPTSGYTLVVTVGGDVVADNKVNAVTTVVAMAGGVASAAGQPQISTVTLGGTFDPGDKFSIVLGEGASAETYGYDGSPDPVAEIVLTHSKKMYAAGGSLVNFSGVNRPDLWNRDNQAAVGAGFINASNQDGGSDEVTGLEVYEGSMAIFAPNAVQIWNMSDDPANNALIQTLRNTGTRSPRSTRSFGSMDVFYLASSGIRTLRARDGTNTAYANDIGTPIDPEIQEYLRTLTAEQIERAVSVIEPLDERYWLAVGDRVYVFSYFPGSKISAWSYFEPGITISDFARVDDRLYVRAGDVIYLYGGTNGVTYPDADEMPVLIETPFFDASRAATKKQFQGYDQGALGLWDVYVLYDPNNENRMAAVAQVEDITYHMADISKTFKSSHVALKLVCSAAGDAAFYSTAIHHNMEDAN